MRKIGIFNDWRSLPKKSIQGQMITLFILVIGVIFILMTITLNIGQIGAKKLSLSQSADKAALEVASGVGSYSHYLSVTYLKGSDKRCKFSWSLFLRVFTWKLLTSALLMAVNPILGALAFIASMARVGATSGQKGFLGFMDLGPSAYIEASAWEKLSRQFKKMGGDLGYVLPERALFTALYGVVDDATLVADEHDADEDGSTEDKIPRFFSWYSNEFSRKLELAEEYHASVDDYIEEIIDKIRNFNNQAQNFKNYLIQEFMPLLAAIEACPDLGVDVSFWQPGGYDQEPSGPQPCSALYPAAVCQQYYDCEDETCNEGPYGDYLDSFINDPVDKLIYEIEDFMLWAMGGTDETGETYTGITQMSIEDLRNSLYTILWPQLFHQDVDENGNPDNSGWYVDIGKWQTNITDWITELGSINTKLNACAAGYYCNVDVPPVCVNACCKDLNDQGQISLAIDSLKDFRGSIEEFKTAIEVFQTNITQANSLLESSGFKNRLEYQWTDSKGRLHRVRAIVTPYPIPTPTIKPKRKGFKKCAVLVNGRGLIRVRILRYDEDFPVSFSRVPLWGFRYSKTPGEEFGIVHESVVRYDHTANPPQIHH